MADETQPSPLDQTSCFKHLFHNCSTRWVYYSKNTKQCRHFCMDEKITVVTDIFFTSAAIFTQNGCQKL